MTSILATGLQKFNNGFGFASYQSNKPSQNQWLFFAVIVLFAQNLWADNSFIFGCGPMNGNFKEETYISYSLERASVPTKEGELPITFALRKTLVSEFDESTLEKTVYSPGFMFMEYEDGFEFAYIAKRGEKYDALLMGGKFTSKKTKDDQVIAEVVFMLEFQHTAPMFQSLMEPPEDAETWQCVINLKELRPYQIEPETPEKKSKKLNIKLPEVKQLFEKQGKILPKLIVKTGSETEINAKTHDSN